MRDESNLALWVAVWIIVIGIVVANQWRKRLGGVGLTFAFLLNLWLNHWPAAVIYLLPWYLVYDLEDSLSVVEAGFEQATYALLGFAVGSVIVAPFLVRLFQFASPKKIIHAAEPRLAKMYLVIGLLCFLARFSFIGRLVTLNVLIAAGTNSLLVGLCLTFWQAWREKRRTAFLGWLLVALSFPFFTVTIMGFLAFGVMLFFSIFAFIASFVRPRWKLIVATLLLAYLGLSFYGSYIRDRNIIREIVWGQQAPLADRISQLYLTVGTLEWFNPFNPIHLYFIDLRLNMNLLEGRAVEYLGSGNVEYAGGATLWWSIIGMIPRTVWPGKPTVAGGSELASRYTGIEFAEGTSVGIGLVMEFYVNYGAAAVILGFLCLGVILTVVDSAAGRRLLKGDWKGFTLWFLPGLAMVNPGNSLVEVTTSVGAAVVMAYLINNYLLAHLLRGKRVRPEQKGVMDHSSLRAETPIGGSN